MRTGIEFFGKLNDSMLFRDSNGVPPNSKMATASQPTPLSEVIQEITMITGRSCKVHMPSLPLRELVPVQIADITPDRKGDWMETIDSSPQLLKRDDLREIILG